jgi:Fe2+ or Zn2+ uptake regulation protein
VYQTLHELAAMGEITQIDVGTGSARFDPTLEPHHHLVCDHCHRIVDLPVTFPEVRVPAGASDGFEVRRTEIVFRGRCATCAATAEATVPNQPTHITEEAQPRHG